MRYVGGDYDQFDDDDDEELDDDEDESLDDDEESGSASRSRVNPFGGSSTSSFGSNRPTSSLPGGGARTSAPPSSSSSSGSRLPGTPGPSSPSNRPATPGTSSGGGSSTSPFGVNRPPGGSSSAPGSGGSGGSSNFGGNRPASSGSSFGGSGSGGSGSGSGGSGAGGSGFNRPGSSSSPSSPSGGSSSGGSGSSFGGNRPGGGSSSPTSGSGGSSPSGARPGSSNPFSGGSSSSAAKPAGKDDDKKAGGGVLGGLTSRFGGGKSDDKPATPKSSGGDKAGGGVLGGLTSRFGGGKSDNKPATPKSSGGDKGSGGGMFGGITSRFGGGKTDDKKPAAPSGSSSSPYGARPGSSTSTSSSSGFGGGAKPGASSGGDAGKSGGLFSKSPFGKLGGNNPTGTTAKPSTPAKSGEQRSGLGRLFPFLGGGSASKPADKKARQSKAPHVEGGGLTLDNKLDILGVALVLSSLALIFSRLSTTRGALTESINTLFIQLTGWGSIAIPAAMLAVGIWLIARHFGEEAPVIPRNRIIGIVITYLGLLLLLQYIDSFSYLNRDGSPTDVASLRNVWLPIAINRGTGGGQIGAELYYFLVSNVTEIGAFFVLLFMLILGLMFTLDIGAAEMAMIAVGNVRNLQEGMQRRRERRAQAAAASLEQLTASATAPPISVTKEAVPALPPAPTPALPAASEPALPAGEPVRAERPIAINIGGKKENSPAGGLFNPPEKQAVEKSPAAPTPAPAGGGITARLRGALPLPGNKAPAAETTPAANANDGKVSGAAVVAGAAAGVVGGGLRGLFNRSGKGEAADEKGAKPAAVTAASAPAASSPAAVSSPSPAKTEAPPARLGDLMKPAPATAATAGGTMSSSSQSGLGSAPRSPYAPAAGTSSGSSSTGGGTTPSSPTSPFKAAPAASGSAFRATSVPASTRPEDALDDIDDELDDELEDSEDLSTLAPAQPKGEGPLPRPQSSRFGVSTFGANKPAESGTAAAGDRNDRLNAIRSGSGVSSPTPGSSDSSKAPEKPAASTEAKPVAGGTITLGKASTGTMPAVKPPEKVDAAASSASTTSSPTGGDAKTAQPAAAFWKSPTESATAKAVVGSSDTPAPEAALPKAPAPPPSSAFGKPEDPAGLSLNREGMATASSSTASAPAPASTVPIGRSPEIQRPAGVGTSAPINVPRKRKEWRMPNISQVLMPGSENDFDRAELLRRARIIEETLQSFGAPGKVVEVNTGPVITQFGVEPDYLVTRGGKKNRVKVGAIAQLDKDLQLALGAKSIRIEAPVPGKGYVGIEVPNDAASLVSLRDVMESDQFKKLFNKSPLAIALGQSVDGTPVSADLGSMPHLLIAGTTGSGKSVCVNAIITSLIAMNPPDRVKFIMVDPKRVELTGYNGIPHLVAPVVVELERIVGVLKWVTREMDERYKKFSTAGARNIEDFNKHLGENAEVMPYIVVIIDELADLMMLAPDETERVITRIAALARATGIHLVIATQRPSVDVVTGLIKANFPARIAFAVAGGVDSRVILDQPGAERLLGKGDMLYMSGDAPAALRLQGVYVSDQEIQNITRYWKAQVTADDVPARPISALVVDNTVAEPSRAVVEGNERSQVQQAFWDRDERNTSPLSSGGANDDDIPDDQEDVLYEEAVDMVRRLNKASVSLLQRRLRIGYTRAARLIDRMEEEGIVGPAVEGAKPREVLPQK